MIYIAPLSYEGASSIDDAEQLWVKDVQGVYTREISWKAQNNTVIIPGELSFPVAVTVFGNW